MAKSLLGLLLLFVVNIEAAELRDPTRPLWSPPSEAAASKPAEPLLTAVLIQPDKRLALIGEKYYQVGDTVNGARLLQIEFDHVVLSGRNGTQKLLLTPTIKTRPTAAKVTPL